MNRSPSVEVRKCRLGHGIFAVEAVPKGKLLLQFEGEHLSFDEQCQLDHEGNALQIGQNLYINPKSPGLYTNHSCDPNCYVNPDLWLVAARHIDADEDLTIDYSTTMLERHWEMHDCQCGASLCRGTIRDFDTLPNATQAWYVQQGWALPHVLAAKPPSRQAAKPPPGCVTALCPVSSDTGTEAKRLIPQPPLPTMA